MNIYRGDDKLIRILMKNRFVETSTEAEYEQKQRKFKGDVRFSREIQIYKGDITVFEEGSQQVSKDKITEEELRILILYFKLKRLDFKAFTENLSFDYDKLIERLDHMQEELGVWVALDYKRDRIRRLKRIIDVYNVIKI